MKLHEILDGDRPSAFFIKRQEMGRTAILVLGYRMFMCQPDFNCTPVEWTPTTFEILADDWVTIENIPPWRPDDGQEAPSTEA